MDKSYDYWLGLMLYDLKIIISIIQLSMSKSNTVYIDYGNSGIYYKLWHIVRPR